MRHFKMFLALMSLFYKKMSLFEIIKIIQYLSVEILETRT